MKKLTAGIFTVMLGLCATSGADAAVASKGYVDSFVGEQGSLTQTVADNKSAAANATKAVADDLAGYKTANAAALGLKANSADVYTKSEVYTKTEANAEFMNSAEVSTAITNAVTGENGVLKDYAKVTELDATNQNVTANTNAISAINNGTTGILAQAKTYADGKASEAQTNAEQTAAGALSTAKAELTTEIDKKANSADVYTKNEANEAFMTSAEVEGKIEAAVAENGAVKTVVDTAVSNLENGAVKSNANAIKAINNETTGILAQAKTYAVGKANDALTASVKYTDDYITSLGLQQIASVPVDCSNDTNYCTLTANANGFAWEVIARVEGETVEGRTAVTSKATAKPAAPAALTE